MGAEDMVLLEQEMLRMPGWCTPKKFREMYESVVKERPEVCVEIGVYGGRSLVALAAGCRSAGRGHTWGIDPFTGGSAAEGYDPSDANRQWWSQVDYGAVYAGCLHDIDRLGLSPWCTVLRETAAAARPRFPRIDVLHIDGNHSEAASTSDVALYLPLVRPGGLVWFDDIDWPTTAKAVGMLRAECVEVTNSGTYALCRKT